MELQLSAELTLSLASERGNEREDERSDPEPMNACKTEIPRLGLLY